METRPPKILGLAFLLFGLALCSTGLWLVLSPARYQAEAKIMLEPDASNDGTNVSYDPYFIQCEFEVLQSGCVLSNVVAALKLDETWGKKYLSRQSLKTTEAIRILKSRLKLALVRNTWIISITGSSEDPAEAARIANAIVEVYRTYRMEQRRQLMERGIEVLQQNYEEGEKQIAVLQTNVDFLREKYHIDKRQGPGFDNPSTFSPLPKPMTPAEREEFQKEYERTKPFWDEKRKLNNLLEFHKLLAVKIKFEQANLEHPANSPVQIIEPAVPPQSPIGPDRVLGALLFAVGIFPSVGGFLLLKSSRHQPA